MRSRPPTEAGLGGGMATIYDSRVFKSTDGGATRAGGEVQTLKVPAAPE